MPNAKAAGAGAEGTPFALPANIDDLTGDELVALREQATAAFQAIYDADGGPQAADFDTANGLVDAIETITTRQTALQEAAADNAAKFDALAGRIAPPADTTVEPIEPVTEPVVEPAPADGQPAAPQLVSASGRGVGGAVTASRDMGGLAGPRHRLNAALSGARALAPAVPAPKEDLAITASVGLAGKFEAGAALTDRNALGTLVEKTAKRLPDQRGNFAPRRDEDPYGGVQVASIANRYDHVFGEDTNVDVIAEWIEKTEANRRPGQFEALVAAGGWCAPSENRYDFFNIACGDGGQIDLPTFGVTRGGINFPVSPSMADTFSPAFPLYTAFSNATVPWLWSETDDISAVTGSPKKPCIRVPCSTMSNVRLECYGLCLTAGNLADNAWPESTRNFLRLLMAAMSRASNARYIAGMVGLASAQISVTGASAGVAAPLLGGAELQAWQYRTKYAMCDDDVLELVYPSWLMGAVRSDLARRTGVNDMLAITNAQVAQWFDVRNIRVQFVNDYQVRSTGLPGAVGGITAWPSTVNGLLYAAGTVARGNGMSLDLGVVRDSTLNSTNDFTAAWMEECHLIAKFGHEIMNIQFPVCADGSTGAADITTCQV